MTRALTEQKVLKKLGIEDFRHLSKDKVIELASMLEQMDPEVAKKALEQFPNFAQNVSAVLNDYKKALTDAIVVDDEHVKDFFDVCSGIITALEGMLQDPDLSFDEKQTIILHIKDVADMMAQRDHDTKQFIATLSAIGGMVLTVGMGVLSVALGGKVNLKELPFTKR